MNKLPRTEVQERPAGITGYNFTLAKGAEKVIEANPRRRQVVLTVRATGAPPDDDDYVAIYGKDLHHDTEHKAQALPCAAIYHRNSFTVPGAEEFTVYCPLTNTDGCVVYVMEIENL